MKKILNKITLSLLSSVIILPNMISGNVFSAGNANGTAPIIGTNGSETVNGTSGDDIIDGLAGDDFLCGFDGEDTYIFGKGYGNDSVNEWGSDHSFIVFNDVDSDEISTSIDSSYSLVISVKGTKDSVKISSWAWSASTYTLIFADGAEGYIQKGTNELVLTKEPGAVEEETVDPVEEEPVAPVEEEPVDPVEEEPVAPVEEEPVDPVEEEPVAPVEEEPVDPVEEEPVAPSETETIEVGNDDPVEEENADPAEPVIDKGSDEDTVTFEVG